MTFTPQEFRAIIPATPWEQHGGYTWEVSWITGMLGNILVYPFLQR